MTLMQEVPRFIDSENASASASMRESVACVPVSWGGHSLAVSGGGDELFFCDRSGRDESEHQIHSGGELCRVDRIVIDDSDEEMEPFDAERFVDRLVEDPPSLGREWLGGDAGRVWEAAKPSCTGAAKLFQQVFCIDQQHQPFLCAGPGYGADHPHHQYHHQQSQGMPIVVPHDPILDALFTPCRVMPASDFLAVSCELVRVPSGVGLGTKGTKKNEIVGFRPERRYNIPPPPEAYAPPLQVPMAPLRQPSGGRYGIGLYSPPSSKVIVESAERSPIGLVATYLHEKDSSVIRGEFSPGYTPLTGEDAHSSREYDDERHDFLRRQEVALFVGPKYLTAGPGSSGIVTPAARSAAVDWLSRLHAAAPAASGGSEPLSLETFFLAVDLMDRFLSTATGARSLSGGGGGLGPALKLAVAACLALSSKYQDTQAATLWGVAAASISDSTYPSSSSSLHLGGVHGGRDGGMGVGGSGVGSASGDFFSVLGVGDNLGIGDDGNVDVRAARKELVAMEMQVASALGFRLTVPTALSFLAVFIRRADALGYLRADGLGPERMREEAQQILLCMAREACSLDHPPSVLAASALYWASCVTSPGAVPPGSFAFLAVTGYELEQLCRCLRDMEGVRTGGGGRRGSEKFASYSPYLSRGGGGSIGGNWAGAAFPEHAVNSFFGAGGGHPAIAAL